MCYWLLIFCCKLDVEDGLVELPMGVIGMSTRTAVDMCFAGY